MPILTLLPKSPLRRLSRVLAVLAIALAAGHLVQTLASRKPALVADAVTIKPQDIVQLSAESRPAPPVSAPVPVIEVASGATEVIEPAPTPAPDPISAPAERDCPVDLALNAQAAARIGIVLLSPCRAGERVVLRHAGLAITAKMPADGVLITTVPALLQNARLEVMFADGETVEGVLDLPEAATLQRFGVQWQGPEAFVVHGLQQGADFGQPGDISPDNPGRPDVGSLLVLGDATVEVPLLAQVYTFPALKGVEAEVVIEAMVTEATCGHDLLAETIAIDGGRVEITDLTLAMPDCSGVGDFLVLKNLASDMKIAAN